MLPHENPNADRQVAAFLKRLYEQSQAAPPQPALDFATMPYAQLQAVAVQLDGVYSHLIAALVGSPPEGAPPPERVEITALDGYALPVDIYRPSTAPRGPLPCIVYCHGGGMAFGTARMYQPILQRLAERGAVVVAPEFRSSSVARFPAGVTDCLSAVLWAREQRAALGADKVTIAGDSGGGLLALSTPLVALRRGLDPAALLDGIWADGPLCIGRADPGSPLRSHVDNDGYLFTTDVLLLIRRLYTDDLADSCAFPANADADSLRRFPRTTIAIYELDPLRDEGLGLYRKMLAAGHPDVDCMQLHGLTHCTMVSYAIKPEFSLRQLSRLVAFAS